MSRTFEVSRRTLALALAAVAAAAAMARFVDAPEWLTWPARVVLPAIALAVLPGAVIALVALPRRSWRATELVAIGFGASAALVQLLTIASLTLHVATAVVAIVILALT